MVFGQVSTTRDPLEDSIALYTGRADFKGLIPFARQWVEKTKNSPEKVKYAAALQTLGLGYNRTGKPAEAEAVLTQALAIRKKELPENHPDLAETYHNLGVAYYYLAEYSNSETNYLSAIENREKTLGLRHKDLATSYNSLATVYLDVGQYQKAEAYYQKALDIRKEVFGEEHIEVGKVYSNLGNVYSRLGNVPHAIDDYLKAIAIMKKTLGETHPNFMLLYQNIGSEYEHLREYRQAEFYYMKSIGILENTLGGDHWYAGGFYDNVGSLNYTIGNYNRSSEYLLRALGARKKNLGNEHPDVGSTYNNLGNLYSDIGKFRISEAHYLKGYSILQKKLGKEHPNLALMEFNIGTVNWELGKFDQAEWYGKKYWRNVENQLIRYFPTLSDGEKALFLERQNPQLEGLKALIVRTQPKRPEITGLMFDQQISTKAALLHSSAKWKHRIRNSGDSTALRLFEKWEANQDELSRLFISTDSAERAGINPLLTATEKLERELSLRSENFAKLTGRKVVTWQQVQKALKPGEAAIELVRVFKYGFKDPVVDTTDPKKPTYREKDLVDTILYIALIVKPESKYPEMVVLSNGNELEGKYLQHYQNSIKNQLQDTLSYNQFWGKIGKKIPDCYRIYISPDGVFHNINFNTLRNPKTKKFLLEEKDIRLVTNTKDLLEGSTDNDKNRLATMVGFPNFYSTEPTTSPFTSYRKSPELSYILKMDNTSPLADLPGTKEEIETVEQILKGQGWDIRDYSGKNALEENIKEIDRPRLLHIATHGFFQPDTTGGSNPLIHSGLMLAGAGNTLKGVKATSREDGILTAYEAMNLNLDNTDLVVLSACETGLGEIKNGEGVYGLQRAFKVAGAKSIIMSLWKVDDVATQELMVGFYKNWLGQNSPDSYKLSGLSKRIAFLKAQKDLKAKYPNPYYWGAFVMVGE